MSDTSAVLPEQSRTRVEPPPQPPTLQASTSKPNTPEQLARQILKNTYDPYDNGEVTDITVSRVIPNILGGTLCVLEYEWFTDKQSYDCCVIIKGENGDIYDSVPDVMRMIAEDRVNRFTQMSEPRFVIAVLTFSMLAIGVALYWVSEIPHAVPEPFRSGLTAVIGYWLGQVLPLVRTGGSPLADR